MPSEVLFGTRLRAQREARGVTLEAIAQHTKVSQSLLADMERGRFDRWPPGIFGRSFIRGYAEAISLDADVVVAEFVDIFPDARLGEADGPGLSAGPSGAHPTAHPTAHSPAPSAPSYAHDGLRPRSASQEPPSSPDDLRLVLVDDAGGSAGTGRWRSATWLGSGIDAAFVLVPAMVTALATTGWAACIAAGLAGLGALVVATTHVGGSPGLWWLRRRGSRPELVAVYEQPVEDLFITSLSHIEERPPELIVSPDFYRPPSIRRYGHRARPA